MHGFGKGHLRKLTQIHALHALPEFANHALHNFTHLRCGQEGGFHIDLRKFGLTVCA